MECFKPSVGREDKFSPRFGGRVLGEELWAN